MPVTGTYKRRELSGVNGPLPSGRWAGELTSSRQKPPYVNAPYKTIKIRGTATGTPNVVTGDLVSWVLDPSNLFIDNIAGVARNRLTNKLIRSRAALGVSIASAGQAYNMISTRALQLYFAYKSLKQGRFKRFLAHLGLNPRKYGRPKKSALKDTAGTWLEYTFGWAPLVGDIYSAVDVIQGRYSVERSHGTCSKSESRLRKTATSENLAYRHVRVVCTSHIKVINPSLGLANQLGLVNPFQVAWDLVPFSFVVDWFVKVNKFIGQSTDMLGYDYDTPITTTKIKGVYVYSGIKGNKTASSSSGERRQRVLGIPSPPKWPHVTIPGKSLWLAATSTSLLATLFLGKK